MVVALGTLLGTAAFAIAQTARSIDRIASEDFAPSRARAALARPPAPLGAPTVGEGPLPGLVVERKERLSRPASDDAVVTLGGFSLATARSPRLPDEDFTAILLIGTDASRARADVMILALLPEDGSPPAMVSLPRDLYLPNPCTGTFTRLNSTFNGCGERASGPELAALAVEDFTGIEVDHYARVDFPGFIKVIDWMGGVTICPRAPTRDRKAHLDIGADCHTVGGATALAWVRSRQPEQLIDGEWRPVGGSDFVRQRRQQELLVQLARRLAAHSSVANLAAALENLSHAVRVDEGWSVAEMAALGFRYRGLDPDDIVRLTLPVEDHRTAGGEMVLLPTETFHQTLRSVYPSSGR